MLESAGSRPSVMRRDCRSLTSLPLSPGFRFRVRRSVVSGGWSVGVNAWGQERVNRTLSTILASAPKAESRPRIEVIWDSVSVGRQVTPGGGGVGGVGACPPKFPPEIWEGEGGS